MTSLEEKFINFYQSSSTPEAPGINDIYSVKDIQNFEKEIKVNYSTSNKIEIKKEFIKNKIANAKEVEKGIDDMIKKFNLSELPDTIDNKFPEGYNPESIQNLEFEYLNNSATKFKELCGKLFQDVYTKKTNPGELESIFGSMSNYPVIVPQSFGLMPIEGLWKIFEEFYLKNDKDFLSNNFFKDFLENLQLNKGYINLIINDPNFDNNNYKFINNKFKSEKFNPKLWYDLKTSKSEGNYDSYGFFYADDKDKKQYVYLKFSKNIYLEFLKLKLKQDEISKLVIEKLNKGIFLPILGSDPSIINKLDKLFNEKDFSERIPYFFKNAEFLQSLNKYFTEIRKDPESLSNSVRGKTNYDKIEVGTPLYNSVRALLHFSNIYTTYMKLLTHFFKNIYECYKIYLSLIKDTKRKSQNKSNKEAYLNKDIDDIQKKLKVLLNIIQNIPEQFDSQLVDYNNERDPTIKFIGYKEIKYDWVANFRINTDNDFMKILMTFFKLNEKNLPVGGIPMKILKEESDFNKFIVTSFNFFLKYRFKSNKQYIELLENYKKQADEKLPREKYSFVKKEVEKKISEIDKDTKLSSTDENIVFKNCKIILKYSIIFVFNLYIKTIKQFKSENNTSLSKSEITNKIGEFKEYINQYIYNLRNKLTHLSYYTFNQFLFGYLSQYIYLLENYNEKKSENAYKKLQILLKDKNKNSKFEMIAENIVDILTNDKRSLTTKKRLKIVGREYITLSNNAKRQINRYINPEIYTSLYWANYEKKFMENNNNKKLFVIAVEPKIAIIEKLAKVSVYLIDLFATLKSDSPPKISREIKTIRVFNDNDNTITKEIYSNENKMIELNHIFRTVRDIAGKIQKSWSKNIIGSKKRMLFGRIFSAEGLQRPGFLDFTPGHTFAKTFGIYKREIGTGKNKSNLGYTATEKLQLLTNGKLSSYTQSNKNQGDFINMALLMGYNKNQLNDILKTYGNYITRRANRLYDFDPDQTNDWQVYVIRKENYESANSMREWANRLLNSKPLIFLKEYENKNVIPLSDFNKIQAPFSRYFIKSWIRHTYPISKEITDYLLDIFNGFYVKSITKEDGTKDPSQNTLFVSADTFFDYDVKYNYEDNSLTKSENRNRNRNRSVFNLNNESIDVKFEANRTFNTNSLIKIPNKFKSKPLIPPSVKPVDFKLTNVFSKSSFRPTNVSGLSTLSDTKDKFAKLLFDRNIKNNPITIYDENSKSNDLIFNLNANNFSITYLGITKDIIIDKQNNSFYVDFGKVQNNQFELWIEFKEDSIDFFKKDKQNFILKTVLTKVGKDNDNNYLLFNDYGEYNLERIFQERFNYNTETIKGFFFYVQETSRNTQQYKLQLKDNSKQIVFEVIIEKVGNQFTYINPTTSETYKQYGSNYLLESNNLTAIISIPQLQILKYNNGISNKINFVNDGFEWKETNTKITRDEFKNVIKSSSSNSIITRSSKINSNSKFLIDAIDKFKLNLGYTEDIDKNGIFKINDEFSIDTKKKSIIYIRNEINLVDDKNKGLMAVLIKPNNFNSGLSFIIDRNKNIFLYNYLNFDINGDVFNGFYILDFSKLPNDELIPNKNFANVGEIKDFFNSHPTANFFKINFFNKISLNLAYQEFFQIYYGNFSRNKSIFIYFNYLDSSNKIWTNFNLLFVENFMPMYIDTDNNTIINFTEYKNLKLYYSTRIDLSKLFIGNVILILDNNDKDNNGFYWYNIDKKNIVCIKYVPNSGFISEIYNDKRKDNTDFTNNINEISKIV